MLEMVSRVQAVLKRSERSQSDGSEEIISYAGIKIDKKRHSVTVDGSGLDLTPKEYELLTCFTENPGIVFSRDQLLEKIFFLFECSLFVFFPRSYSW
jgi:two-component system alkaline phosphatase synthesis response regulator PhoP